jgi:Fe-S cluster assembly iron-binding protein IscA
MLTVTKKAAELLKAAKVSEGAADQAGFRIHRNAEDAGSERPTIGLAIIERPEPDDEEFEQQGLRIFVQEELIEVLDDRTLDVRDGYQGPELIWR